MASSRTREALCTCSVCKGKTLDGWGVWMEKWRKEQHMKEERLGKTSFGFRGRNLPTMSLFRATTVSLRGRISRNVYQQGREPTRIIQDALLLHAIYDGNTLPAGIPTSPQLTPSSWDQIQNSDTADTPSNMCNDTNLLENSHIPTEAFPSPKPLVAPETQSAELVRPSSPADGQRILGSSLTPQMALPGLRRSARRHVIQQREDRCRQEENLLAFRRDMAAREAAEQQDLQICDASSVMDKSIIDMEGLEDFVDAAVLEALGTHPEPSSGDAEDVLDGEIGSAAIVDMMRSPDGAHIPIPLQRRPALATFQAAHSLWFVRITMSVVALLHAKHHVSFRACNLILFTLSKIFSGLGVLPADNPMPQSLGSVLKRLDLEDRFCLYPICAACHRIFQTKIAADSTCPDCHKAIFKPLSSSLFRKLTGKPAPAPAPYASTPIQTLSSLLVDFLARPEVEPTLNSWRTHNHQVGKYTDITDGTVWRTLRGPDGKLFFDPTDTHISSTELRIGVTMAFDWFCRKTSVYGPSYSIGAMSFCVSNLPPPLRYRVENLLLPLMTPGPSEPNAEHMQNYLKIIVDDLTKLYEDGITIVTPAHPKGILVRVVLLAVNCDHPAMCKLGGFGDHSHRTAPCSKCTVSSDKLFSENSLRNKFPKKNGAEHRQHCSTWRDLPDSKSREEYFKRHGVRWTELARLRYFDLVRCCIVDPMHNMLLGIVKAHWYGQWIKKSALRSSTAKKTRELDVIHGFLESFESPLWAGKLPIRVGEPAGGSLSADEYKFAATTALPIIIPFVWDIFLEDALLVHQKECHEWPAVQEQYKGKLAEWQGRLALISEQVQVDGSDTVNRKRKKIENECPKEPKKPTSRMQEGEDILFLKLSAALKVLLATTVTERSIQRGATLLEQYLVDFRDLYGEEAMKPNHHWCVHLPDQLCDFGPVYGFWTFLGERLNKSLKNFNSNSHQGGEMEASMMREFGRNVHVQSIFRELGTQNIPRTENTNTAIASHVLLDAEAQGTVQDASMFVFALDDALSNLRYQPGSVSEQRGTLSESCQLSLVSFYNVVMCYGVHHALDVHYPPNSCPLSRFAQFYEYALLEGRRITPLSRNRRKSAGSSLISVSWGGRNFVGEVLSIFHHLQYNIQTQPLFAEVRWLKPLDMSPIEGDPWMN